MGNLRGEDDAIKISDLEDMITALNSELVLRRQDIQKEINLRRLAEEALVLRNTELQVVNKLLEEALVANNEGKDTVAGHVRTIEHLAETLATMARTLAAPKSTGPIYREMRP